MKISVPTHGYLEPFSTTKNIGEIASRIKETTFGQICCVPGEATPTVTEPPREALVSDIDLVVSYALHLRNVVAASSAEETSLWHYKQSPNKWFSVKRNVLPHIINGYYTASILIHSITGDFKPLSYEQQNKFSALMTTISNFCIGVTDATYQNHCAHPGEEHSMTEETIRKLMCGRPPIEWVWQEVYDTI
jgi:hypothetical protein